MSANKRRPKRNRRGEQVELTPGGLNFAIDHLLQPEVDGETLADIDIRDFILEMHPDFLEIVRAGRSIPNEATGSDGEPWSPHMHINMHTVVEAQLARDEPKGIRSLAQSFEAEGKIDSHEIRHAIMNVFAEFLWKMQDGETEFDSKAYLREIPNSYRAFCEDA